MTVVSLIAATALGTVFSLFKVSGGERAQGDRRPLCDIIHEDPSDGQVFIIYFGCATLKPYGFQWNALGGASTAGMRGAEPERGSLPWRGLSAAASGSGQRDRWEPPKPWTALQEKPCAK